MAMALCGDTSSDGGVFWLILPRLDADCVQAFLDEFVQEHAKAGKRIL